MSTRKRILSMLLTAVLLLNVLPTTAVAEGTDSGAAPDYSVTGFAALPEDATAQSVSLGTSMSALTLPDTLSATGSAPAVATPSAVMEKTEITIPGVTWQSTPEYEPDTVGTYTFTAELPQRYTLADGVDAPVITVEVAASHNEQTGQALTFDIPLNEFDETTSYPAEGVPVTDTGLLAGVMAVMLAAPLVPSNLSPGTYTVEESGGSVILTNGSESCFLTPSTEITVTGGDLTLMVNADVTIQSIKIFINGSLTIDGVKTLTSTGVVYAYTNLTVAAGATLEANDGVETNGNMIVEGTLKNTGSAVWASGDITVSGTLSSNSGQNSGIYSLEGSFYIDGGTVTANNNSGNGVWMPQGGITIENGGSLTTNGNTYPGTYIGSGYNLNINEGALTANNNDDNGVWMQGGNITIENGGSLTTNGNTYPGIGVASGYSLSIDGGSVTANENSSNGVWMQGGNITVENGGSLATNGNTYPGVWVEGNITVADGELMAVNSNKQYAVFASQNIIVGADGTLTGMSKYSLGVFAVGNIEVSGKLTGTSEDDTDGDTGVCANGNIAVSGELTGNGFNGVVAGGNIEVSGVLKGNGFINGVWASDNITINAGGTLTGDGPVYGVYADGSIEVSGDLTSIEGSYGVRAGKGITIYNGGTLTSKGIVQSGNSDIDIKKGGKLTGKSGVIAGNIAVSGTLNNTGSDVWAYGDITVSGTLTSKGSNHYGIGLDGDLSVNGGTIIVQNNYLNGIWLYGDISVENGGRLTAEDNGEIDVLTFGNITVDSGTLTGTGSNESGISADNGYIAISNGGIITGAGVIYGVYVGGDIAISGMGSVIKGVAETRGDGVGDTASVYTSGGTISATGGGTILEEYTNTPMDFDNQTAKDPYADGSNIADIANYTWTPDLTVSGSGLMATRNYTGTQTISGTRKGNISSELVTLDTDSTHIITFSGTLTVVLSDAKEITGYTIPNQVEDTGIFTGQIYITMPYGTDLSNLTPTIVHSGVFINPASGIPQDFTNPVEYTVTAEDGSEKTYTVFVYAEDPELAVESVTPTGTGVSIFADTLMITFNQEMMGIDGSVVISGGAALSNPRWSADKTTISYDLAGLDYNTEYTVTIEDFVSRTESKMAEAYVHIFTTELQTYTVTYNANGGNGSAPSEADKTAGETFTAANNTFTAPGGWQFKEWNTKADGTGTGYTEGGEITMPAENLALYAIWEPIPTGSVKVTFDPQGGTVAMTSKTVVYNEAYGSLPIPARDGYTFKGWYTENTGGAKVVAVTIVSSNADHTLYAHWTAATTSTDSTSTGDSSVTWPWLALSLGALGMLMLIGRKRKNIFK